MGSGEPGRTEKASENRSLEGVKPILASEGRREASRYRRPGSRTERRTPGAGRAGRTAQRARLVLRKGFGAK